MLSLTTSIITNRKRSSNGWTYKKYWM